ncbi:phosphoribosylglycinamide formyltransferase 1 [Thermotomaculum hydrothermale]|uniref:Phosphoribosylglycinamide formyltransferase n=1 Tax=Thermotomaculum hydrothermale TaxID=981385 RepID=A0A7R6PMR5_9BACT|nr:phosphoribosylglycinamide formyltransferase [Thermotomaculum hydrothermale]BBB32947.1 phosphoribosylglycinamide formyltransferase 1 [Thermotomaculum hydrothermale]
MDKRIKIAVLLSGTGRTLDNFVKKIEEGKLKAEIVCVASSKTTALGLKKAIDYGIPAKGFDIKNHRELSEAINKFILEFNPDLIVLAGFLKMYYIPQGYENRVINIHPALIPMFCGKGFYGMKVHKAVWESGVKVTGCTVHFVNDEYDKGLIIAQRCVPVFAKDTPESIANRVFEAECELYPYAINLFAENKIEIKNNKVYIEGE